MLDFLISKLSWCNTYVFFLINVGSDSDLSLLKFSTFVAKWVILIVPIVLTALWIFGSQLYRYLAVRALSATLCGLMLNYIIGILCYHPRPFAAGVGNSILHHSSTSSFPSNHGTIMFTVAFVLVFSGVPIVRRIGLVLLIPSAAVAWARVYVGVHWPLDMVGAVVMALSMVLLSRVQRYDQLNKFLTKFLIKAWRCALIFCVSLSLGKGVKAWKESS